VQEWTRRARQEQTRKRDVGVEDRMQKKCFSVLWDRDTRGRNKQARDLSWSEGRRELF
jgi:hypothetical protein